MAKKNVGKIKIRVHRLNEEEYNSLVDQLKGKDGEPIFTEEYFDLSQGLPDDGDENS